MTVRDPNRRYHDRIAARYDQIYDTPYWRFYRDVSWRHTKRWLPTQRPASAVDLGCGTGWFGRRLAKSGFAGVAGTGGDFAEAMTHYSFTSLSIVPLASLVVMRSPGRKAAALRTTPPAAS